MLEGDLRRRQQQRGTPRTPGTTARRASDPGARLAAAAAAGPPAPRRHHAEQRQHAGEHRRLLLQPQRAGEIGDLVRRLAAVARQVTSRLGSGRSDTACGCGRPTVRSRRGSSACAPRDAESAAPAPCARARGCNDRRRCAWRRASSGGLRHFGKNSPKHNRRIWLKITKFTVASAARSATIVMRQAAGRTAPCCCSARARAAVTGRRRAGCAPGHSSRSLELNELCLGLIAEQAAAHGSHGSACCSQVGELWCALDAPARRRAAACPYLLLDAGFADTARWRRGGRAAGGRCRRASYAAFFTVPAAAELARLVFTYAWHLARTQAAAARLLLGMPLGSALRDRPLHAAPDTHARRRPQRTGWSRAGPRAWQLWRELLRRRRPQTGWRSSGCGCAA